DLASVWTFDRERPDVDAFPLRLPIAATPCATLLMTQRTLALEDTGRDGRVPREQQLAEMRAFVGVPLLGHDGAPKGALCHFDSEPRPPETQALELLELTAPLLHASERRKNPR